MDRGGRLVDSERWRCAVCARELGLRWGVFAMVQLACAAFVVALILVPACGGEKEPARNQFQEEKKENKVEVSLLMPSGVRRVWLFAPGSNETVDEGTRGTLTRSTPMVFVVHGPKGPQTYTCGDRAIESHNDHTVYSSNEMSSVKFTVWN